MHSFSSIVSRLVAFLSIAVCSVHAQTWVDVTGNIAGGIPDVEYAGPLASDGTNLFVNAGDGVVRTTDGNSFTRTADIDKSTWQFVKVVNGEVWVGDAISSQHYTYLWRSSDLGATWNAASNGMPGDVDLITVDDVSYDEDTGLYWAASQFGGAYRSEDGTNWTQHRVGLPQTPYFGYSMGKYIVAEGGDVMLSMIGDGNIVGAGIFRTQNDGASWAKLPEVVAGGPGNFIQIEDRILYSSSGINLLTGGLFITEDFGDTWTFQDQWLDNSYSMSTDGTTVFACFRGGVWFSANQGDSWEEIDTTGLTPGWNAVAIEKVGNNLFLFSEENNIGKLYRMDVSGVQFIASTQITLEPAGDEVLEGNAITLEGDAIGTGAVTYQWQQDGVDVPGATSKSLTLDPLELSDAGAYTLIATANGQSATSSVATVVVKNRNIGAPDPQFAIGAYINGTAEVAVLDTEGYVWYSGAFTTSNNSIIKVDPVEGTILATLGGALEGKSGSLDSMGKLWIGNNNAQLHRITTSTASIDFTVDIKLGENSGRVNEIKPYGDEGKVLLAGLFDKVAGVDTGAMALLNHDGTVDTSFDFGLSGISITEIKGMDVDADGNIYVISGDSYRAVYKLNPDGSHDDTWWPGGKRENQNQSNLGGDLRDIKVLLDGTILLGFRNTYTSNAEVITASQNIMHIAADGSWLNDFNVGGTGTTGEIWEIVQAPDGKLIIRGDFNAYNGATYTSGNRNITRLLVDGSPDPYWNPSMEGWRGSVYSVAIDADGNVFGGTNHSWYNGTNMSRILKLAGDVSPVVIVAQPQPLTILDLGETATFQVFAFGTTDVSYQWRKDGVDISGANSDILELANIDDADDGYYDVIVSNGSGTLISEKARLMTVSAPKYIIQPMAINGQSGDEITLSVEAIGLGDLTYQWFFEGEAIVGATDSAFTIPFASVGNTGSYYVEVTGSSGTTSSDSVLVVVEAFAGALDKSFDVGTGFNKNVYSLVELDDGSVIAGGYFTDYNGVSVPNIAKIDARGVLDETWPSISASNTWVASMALQDDGKLLLGGPFNTVNGWSNAITRLNEDGTFDDTFNAAGTGFSANSGVLQVAVQENGKILLLVNPTYNSNPIYNEVPVTDLFRINSDGSLDETFAMIDTSNQPAGFELLSTGKILLYGNFTTVNGESHSNLVRLNEDGSIDSSFALDGDPDGPVTAVDETTDGKIVVGGSFSTIGGESRRFVALLDKDGSVNEAFDTSTTGGSYPSGSIIDAEALLNGDVLVIGNFLGWGSQTHLWPYRIATIGRDGQKTGFGTDTHVGFSSNPTGARLLSGVGHAYAFGAFPTYHSQTSPRLARIHLESMDLVFLEQPQDQYVEAGETATFSADVLGTTTVGYQWYKDSVAVAGATSDTLEIANAQESDVGIYTLEVINASGSTVSAPVVLHILAEPEVVNNPVGKIVKSGNSTTLVAAGIGADPLSLQWYHDDEPMVGEKGATLVLTGVLAEDAGLYHAVYTNNLGSVSTTKVALSVEYGAAGVDGDFTPGFYGSPGISFIGKTPDNGYRIAGSFGSNNGLSSLYAGITEIGTPMSLYMSGWTFGAGGVQRGDFAADGSLVGMNGSSVFRLLGNGSIDTNFDASGVSFPNFTSPVLNARDDGSALIGDMNFLTRLNADGSVDDTFNVGGAGPVGQVSTIAVSSTGKIFIGGTFTSYNGVDMSGMALLNADGTLDGSFDPGTGVANGEFIVPINAAEFAADGKIYIGGSFTTYNGDAVQKLFRIGTDGTLDTGFAPGEFSYSYAAAASVRGIMVLPDTSILVRGSFNQYAGGGQGNVVALDASGNRIDGMVGLGYNGIISDWVLEPNGSITMVGSFYSPKNRMMRINPVPPAFQIVAQPEVFTADAGEAARLEVAVSGQGPFTFQWKKDGVDVEEATSFYLDFDPVMVSDRGAYTVEVSNGLATLESNAITPTITGYEPTPFTQWMIDQGAVGIRQLEEADDYDGDTVSNGLEYALGLDPIARNTSDAPKAEFVRGSELGLANSDLYLVMTVYIKRGLSGVTVTPRASLTLLGLSSGASDVVTVSGPVVDGDFDVYEYRSSFGVSDANEAAFMDLKATIVLP